MRIIVWPSQRRVGIDTILGSRSLPTKKVFFIWKNREDTASAGPSAPGGGGPRPSRRANPASATARVARTSTSSAPRTARLASWKA